MFSFDTADLNQLPYAIRERATGHKLPVYFAPLREEDTEELQENWQTALFADYWNAVVVQPELRAVTLKLIRPEEDDRRILGLVYLGEVTAGWPLAVGERKDCILETAPWNQYTSAERRYSGVGRILVGRLIAESIRRGRDGALALQASPRSVTFYLRLGFVNYPGYPRNFYYILEEAAKNVLQDILRNDEAEESAP